ncbi:unnamed protein product, partial [Staurois parvus]
MGKKKDLSAAEKSEIVQCLGRGMKTLDISQKLKRDHRTIKRRFLPDPCIGSREQLLKYHYIAANRYLKLLKRLHWAEKYMKTNFQTVLFTDECHATLDGPDGWSSGWLVDGHPVSTRLRRQQGGSGVMFW